MMTRKAAIRTSATMLFVISGTSAADVQPQLAPRGTMPSHHVAHIYYNIATGEKIAVPLGDVRPADNGVSSEVWIADNVLPCADYGQAAPEVGVMDVPCDSVCFSSTLSSPGTGFIFMDWGDISPDTVVDCVGITWSSQHADTDLNGDGMGDGVLGLGATWAWFDAENGFDSSATRLDLIGFTFFDLPGDYSGLADQDRFATYTATVDLGASFSSSLLFEIGDTDSVDGSGTGLFNPGAGADLDSDGLADFGYAMQYIQPGTFDFDSDGLPDGDPDALARTGWTLVTGNGDIGTDGSYIPETGVPGAQGIEDAYDFFVDRDSDGVLEWIGTFFYGGFSCSQDSVGDPGFTPYAQFYMKHYGPSNRPYVDCGDYFPPGGGDGVLNFFDVATFLDYFNNQNPLADLFMGNGVGVFDFFDLASFISVYTAGCP